jgi:hypothetical protein
VDRRTFYPLPTIQVENLFFLCMYSNKILYEQHSVYFIRSKNCSPLASTWLIPGFSMASMVLIILIFCMMLYSAAYLLLFLFLFFVFIFVLFCFFVFCFCLFFICPMLPLSLESLFLLPLRVSLTVIYLQIGSM